MHMLTMLLACLLRDMPQPAGTIAAGLSKLPVPNGYHEHHSDLCSDQDKKILHVERLSSALPQTCCN